MCKLVDNATQLDVENALTDGITQKQAQYRRIEAEKRIRNILILDDYINWVEDRPMTRISETLVDNVNYHVVRNILNRYPFDGGHFNVNVHSLLKVLNRNNLIRYCKAKSVDVDLTSLFNVTEREMHAIQKSRTFLLTLSKYAEIL
ncbi:hypothetical protein GR11A_00033 [Vibrio phage vB_VcorM_GR11A]|nr:hypothetical protein GR11A_00033 [Vibrio phage vB_VcorM_GR11A]